MKKHFLLKKQKEIEFLQKREELKKYLHMNFNIEIFILKHKNL